MLCCMTTSCQAKTSVFADEFCSKLFFIGHGFTNCFKVEFNFEAILYIAIFVSKIQEAALNLQSVFKTHLKVQ